MTRLRLFISIIGKSKNKLLQKTHYRIKRDAIEEVKGSGLEIDAF
jgi:hypothetical protein